MTFDYDPDSNVCILGKDVRVDGFIKGKGNTVEIESPLHECRIDLRICGNNNVIKIKSPFAVKGLIIRIGNHVQAHRVRLSVDQGFSIEGGSQFLLYNSGNILEIGSNCMFSNAITVRCGDSPHLLFDRETGDYLDISEGVFIGDHVWVGERAYITKNVSVARESVVAACSVVSKRFPEEHVVLGGNPAKVVRRNVQWIRNHSHLIEGSAFKESYQQRQSIFFEEE